MPAERRAVATVFLALGTWTGTYVSRLPWIAARLHLSSGVLGLVGLAAGVGAVTTMPFAARFVHSYGAKAATRVLIAGSGAVLVLPALAPNAVLLALALLLAGAICGNTDAAMNVQGVAAEGRIGKSIMSGLHGMWSAGVVVGAFTGSLAAREQIDPRLQFALMGGLILVAGVTATCWFADGRGSEPGSAGRSDESAAGTTQPPAVPYFAWPRGLALLLGLMAFAAIFVEFTANDWSALFMRWELHTSQATAAIATGVFALTMAAGRLSGDAVIRRLGPERCIRVSGLIATGGCLLVALAPSPPVAFAGFMLVGVGVAVVVPLVFVAAGRCPPAPAISIAGVATLGYGAGLAAPSMMGGVADVFSLRAAFAVASLIALAVAAGAGLLAAGTSSEAGIRATAARAFRRRSV
ncbi:MAG: MFS transporter [Streptosporangiaceae bacterium]